LSSTAGTCSFLGDQAGQFPAIQGRGCPVRTAGEFSQEGAERGEGDTVRTEVVATSHRGASERGEDEVFTDKTGLDDPCLPAHQDRTHALFQSTSGVGGQEGELAVAPDEDRIGRDGPGREGGWILHEDSMSLLHGFLHRDVQAYVCFLVRVLFSLRKQCVLPRDEWGAH